MPHVLAAPRRLARWIRTHRRLSVCLAVLLALVAVNVVAFNQAWSMTHFAAAGSRTAPPESLSLLGKARVALLGVRLPRPVNSVDPTHFGLDFETVRFGGPTGSELEGWFIPCDHPKGAVLFAHGYGASKSSLLAAARAVHCLGYAVLLLDFHGSGGSQGATTTIGFREADDVADAVAWLTTRCLKCPLVLYGQSMGSAAVLRAIAFRGVEPDGLILESPFDRLLSTAANRFRTMGLPPFPLAHLLIFWGGVQSGFNGFGHNPADYARHVRCPTLLLHGEDDVRATLEQARSVLNNVRSEMKSETLFAAGHESLHAADPERWTAAVSHFLAQLDKPPATR
jgi:alpha-beta hydrolase superfamily lysophospholipase